ncbi:DNA-processing protein DprA [Curtobacterium sp. MCLR17_007]|uniref:DNA-processing protein DprA n=1 Tax=Curtobacterium sp. MCLR17_007 TaxID=2175648 RepID=UPI0021ACD2E5|nr:DNA-processing protein DprA [Curtobacterium sp. MCLR17_007]WIB58956.1 DNA-processing protein DprA [Curtobacterium sp. MCLR17_007]
MSAADAEALARVAWSALVEPGDSTAGALVRMLGAERSLRLATGPGPVQAIRDACAADVHADDSLADGLADALVGALERWRPRFARADPERILDAATAVGATLLLPGDPEWPAGMDDLGEHAPLVLWRRGRPRGDQPPVVSRPCLSVVGARSNTLAGAEACAEITSAAADAGCTTVSGGAYGIDAVAHRVAIAAGTPTVAVLAGGVDQLYPAGHVELLGNVGRQGMLLAESPPGTPPTRWRFLARNRLIAALGHTVVVVEAAARSGALNTAHHAAQLGRPVFAVPGAFSSPASVGCHRLVADGVAQLAVYAHDPVRSAVAVHCGVDPDDTPTTLCSATVDPETVRVVDALGRRPITVVEVAERSGLSVAAATDTLALAELQGLVERRVDGWVLGAAGRSGPTGRRA